MKKRTLVTFIALLSGSFLAIAQPLKVVPNNWFLLDPATDSVQGVSAEKVYTTLLKGKSSRNVIVAVIDSGIDIDHEDLKDVIWVNADEIAGNGIDDDKNGYVDDVHGWNFIGGKSQEINAETLEVTREYGRLRNKYVKLPADKVSKKDKAEFTYWESVNKRFKEDSSKTSQQYAFYLQQHIKISHANDTLKKVLQVDTIKYDQLAKLDLSNPGVKKAKEALDFVYTNAGKDAKVEAVLTQIKGGVDYFEPRVSCGYNPACNVRKAVGDDVNNTKEKYYGNNNVEGPDPFHGTHVAGIIAGNRKNDIGIKGIADNVTIMVVRAVPNGDERDKDVANAIIYAVDNGANIVNMSFGKDFSPDKTLVNKAVKYAEGKGVLLIHAAGNDGKDNDLQPSFPNQYFVENQEAKNWIEVGASAAGVGDRFVASFSNYGKKSVDLFAPGVRLYSSIPDNKYGNASGTSMACPATVGVAAIIMEYFPQLSAVQVKNVLEQSTRKFDGLQVTKPGSKEKIDFTALSSSGGLVNAFEAVKLAMTLKSEPAKK